MIRIEIRMALASLLMFVGRRFLDVSNSLNETAGRLIERAHDDLEARGKERGWL